MNVLSLFDGISCGQVALKRAGIEVGNYYACEIDKFAKKVTQANFPNTFQLGDIKNWKNWGIDLGSIDLIQAGFPCQAWSVAGKQQGDNDPRGALVHDLIDIWKAVQKENPNVKFLFENVRMKKEFVEYINNLFGVEPVEINSALVSAQNRKRLYWTNIPNVTQPEDRGILLKDIIAYSRSTRYPKEGESYVESRLRENGKANTLTTGSGCGSFSSKNLIPIRVGTVKKGSQGDRIYSTEGKAITLNAQSGGTDEAGNMLIVDREKSHYLDANYAKGTNIEQYKKKRRQIVFTNEEMDQFRKLTPEECELLQTLPIGYTKEVSNTQRYKGIGNGWTVDVITHIYKGLK